MISRNFFSVRGNFLFFHIVQCTFNAKMNELGIAISISHNSLKVMKKSNYLICEEKTSVKIAWKWSKTAKCSYFHVKRLMYLVDRHPFNLSRALLHGKNLRFSEFIVLPHSYLVEVKQWGKIYSYVIVFGVGEMKHTRKLISRIFFQKWWEKYPEREISSM